MISSLVCSTSAFYSLAGWITVKATAYPFIFRHVLFGADKSLPMNLLKGCLSLFYITPISFIPSYNIMMVK
jgi:hypothetical protein